MLGLIALKLGPFEDDPLLKCGLRELDVRFEFEELKLKECTESLSSESMGDFISGLVWENSECELVVFTV